jgi:putative GTP pyrophosphokinase
MPRKTNKRALEAFLKTLEEQREDYKSCALRVKGLLQELLHSNQIDVASVDSRVKTLASIRQKIELKRYDQPQKQLTDICGLRVIVYLESDVAAVLDLLRREFDVDESNSVDKRESLQTHEVGYRSVHLLCALSDARSDLTEYSRFKNLRFEIQVRTILQHAWAQIEWGRNYKFGGVLPKALQRRLMLASGALEILDREFSAIASDVEAYSRQQDPDEPINTLILRAVASEFLQKTGAHWQLFDATANRKTRTSHADLLAELQAMGVHTRDELVKLLAPDFMTAVVNHPDPGTNEFGFFRDAMMWKDIEKYFETAHQGHWQLLGSHATSFLEQKYSRDVIIQAASSAGLDVLDSYVDDDDDDDTDT